MKWRRIKRMGVEEEKGGMDCGGFRGLEVKWDIEKNRSAQKIYKKKKWEGGIEIYNESSMKSRQHPREDWAKWSWESCTRWRIQDEVWMRGIGWWAFIVYQDPPLANPEEEETRLSSCLSFSTSLCIPVPKSFQYFHVYTSCSQESWIWL